MKRQTVLEHFHNTILRSFKELTKSGEIPDISKDQKRRNQAIIDAMNRPRLKGFVMHIQQFNNNKFTEKWLEDKIANKIKEEKEAEHHDCGCRSLQLDYLKCLVKAIRNKDNAKDIFKYVEIRDGNVTNNNIEVSQAMNEKQYIKLK